jgi:hypothetical protein
VGIYAGPISSESIMNYPAQHNQAPKMFVKIKDSGTVIERFSKWIEVLVIAQQLID